MSRCFPFPPPGYEKKSTTDGRDLLKKENDRERKRKKDKNYREKREGKEKKDKDRRDGKHRDKDKKEKRREKKERDKDKDRTNALYEKKLNLQFEHNNGNGTTDEKKHLGKPEGVNGESRTQKGKVNDMVRKSFTADKILPAQISGRSNGKFAWNNHFPAPPEDAKDIQQLGQKIKDADRETRSHLDIKFSGDVKRTEEVFKLVPNTGTPRSRENIMRDSGRNLGGQSIGGEPTVAGTVMAECLSGFDSKRDEGVIRVVTKDTDTFDENKEKSMKVDNKRLSDQGIVNEMRFTGNVISENPSGTTQTRIGLDKPLEEVPIKRMELEERTKQKESDHKLNDRDDEKKSKRKDKDRDRDRKKQEKSKDKYEPKKAETDKLNKSIEDDLTATSNVKPSPVHSESTSVAVAAEGDPRKWKDLEQNGFLDASEPEPGKLARPRAQPVIENGRALKACQTSIFSPPGLLGAVDNVMVGNKVHKINGLIEAHASSSPASQSFSISPLKPLLAPSQVDQRAEVSRKPPHPDTKLLDEILLVPKAEEWSTFDGQEWLFQDSEPQSKKSKVCSYGVDETPQVWAETLRIDSVDMYALPYVVPY